MSGPGWSSSPPLENREGWGTRRDDCPAFVIRPMARAGYDGRGRSSSSLRISGDKFLPFAVETIGDDLPDFVESLQPRLVIAACVRLGVGIGQGGHAGILDAHYHQSCFRAGESGLPHPGLALNPEALHELPALLDLLNIGGRIVRLDRDHTQDGCLLREGSARR